jgi:hypothetical protein
MVALRERNSLQEQDSRDYESLAKAQESNRVYDENITATMSPTWETERVLVEAASDFEADVIDDWIAWRSAGQELYREGTKPTDILECLVHTMRTRCKDLKICLIRGFVVIYDILM